MVLAHVSLMFTRLTLFSYPSKSFKMKISGLVFELPIRFMYYQTYACSPIYWFKAQWDKGTNKARWCIVAV